MTNNAALTVLVILKAWPTKQGSNWAIYNALCMNFNQKVNQLGKRGQWVMNAQNWTFWINPNWGKGTSSFIIQTIPWLV